MRADEALAPWRAVAATPSAPTARQLACRFKPTHVRAIERALARCRNELDRKLGREVTEDVTFDLDATEMADATTASGRAAATAGPDSGHARRWWVLAVLGIAQLMIVLDSRATVLSRSFVLAGQAPLKAARRTRRGVPNWIRDNAPMRLPTYSFQHSPLFLPMALTDNIDSISRYEWWSYADAGGRVKMSTHTQHERAIREQLMAFLPIDQDECMRMLATASGRIGRIAISGPGSTVLIRPVNYAFDDRTQSVLFRSALGSQLREGLSSGTAAFEIDGEDPVQRTGWSVIIVGEAEEVTDAAEIDRLRDFELEPWAPGLKMHWVRIQPTEISGRRIVRVSDAMLD